MGVSHRTFNTSRSDPSHIKTEEESSPANGLRRSRRSAAHASSHVKTEEEEQEQTEENAAAGQAPPAKKKAKRDKEVDVKTGSSTKLTTPNRSTKGRTSIKKEEDGSEAKPEVKPSPGKTLAERKLSQHRSSANKTPFPRWPLPTHEEAEKVAWLLGRAHGYRPTSEGGRGLPRFTPPAEEKVQFGGCGDVKDVIEATVRTILSCNTSGRNSTAAHQSLVRRFGNRNWKAILDAPQKDVEEAIRCGGLAVNKSKNIQALLRDTQERYGKLSLQHLHDLPTPEVQEILLSFSGVGPKVQSCVQAFCLGRASFAVDTHVQRLSIALGWVPPKSSREQTYYHLNQRVQDELMYPLHVLLIKHGKVCSNCKASGGGLGKAAKWESSDESDGEVKEEGETKAEVDSKMRGCPLKEAGLLTGRNLKLLPEDNEERENVSKVEKVKKKEEEV